MVFAPPELFALDCGKGEVLLSGPAISLLEQLTSAKAGRRAGRRGCTLSCHFSAASSRVTSLFLVIVLTSSFDALACFLSSLSLSRSSVASGCFSYAKAVLRLPMASSAVPIASRSVQAADSADCSACSSVSFR